MWIQVRTIDGQHSHRIDGLSKLTTIENLRLKLEPLFDAPPERQRLFYRGKQLEDAHTLFDYNVGLNTIVQLMVKPVFVEAPVTEQNDEENPEKLEEIEPEDQVMADSEFDENAVATYKVGDIIDCKYFFMGAWFPAKVVSVERRTSAYKRNEPPRSEVETDTLLNDGFIYGIKYEGYEEDEPEKHSVRYIRPRAQCKIALGDLKKNDVVMVHYNVDDPDNLGHWYDAIVTSVNNTAKVKELIVTIFIGEDMIPLADCNIRRTVEIFKNEKPGSQINIDENPDQELPDARSQKYECDVCKDKASVKKCTGCGCSVCKLKKDADKLLLCDDCDTAYHIYCLNPPLSKIPEADEWYCPECKLDTSEVVQAGEKLKASKKKSKMASATGNTSRDWGRGMACVGRTKVCSIVPSDHFGPIPGVEVGMCWLFRVQASETGVHRPHVAGIAGSAKKGSYSIVLSGGYEDDRDDGEVFTYTGSGGRDLSGNKRTAGQSSDQSLTRYNMALARNCNTPINSNGGTAVDWKKGKPIRVLRNGKAAKHSKYAPPLGNRYDGIYKVEKYWPETGRAGFLVWRYKLRRDDETPAPWTKAGKKRVEELGLELQYPDGWEASQEAKRLKKEMEEEAKAEAREAKADAKEAKGKSKSKRKRNQVSSDEENEDENADPNERKSNETKSPPAKKKLKAYTMSADVQKLVDNDELNMQLWEQAAAHAEEGVTKYLSHVEELFCCICCQDLVFKPITTKCRHNICKSCLQRSFKAEVFSCSACRTELGKDYPMKTNDTLIDILNKLFPGYEAGR